ncbi:MAG: M48 family metallopeptidase [Candidatus Geothermincolia bacterium]
MRLPSDLNFEPEVLASIKRYRRRKILIRAAGVSSLLAGVAAGLVVFLTAAVRGQLPSEAFLSAAGIRWAWFLVIGLLYITFVLAIGPEKLAILPDEESPALSTFRNALEGVSIAVGLEQPGLFVLDVPTVNAVSFILARKPVVGVTKDALESGLPRGYAEAMMAHEVSHVLLGDVFLGANRARWRVVGLSIVAALLLPFFLLALVFGFSVWLYLGLIGWTALQWIVITVLGSFTYRQDDLLSDSVAAKITNDPAALRETILLVDDLFKKNDKPFPPGSRWPELLFVYEARPEVELKAMRDLRDEDDEDTGGSPARQESMDEASLEKDVTLIRSTIAERVKNLEAIERGNWLQF